MLEITDQVHLQLFLKAGWVLVSRIVTRVALVAVTTLIRCTTLLVTILRLLVGHPAKQFNASKCV